MYLGILYEYPPDTKCHIIQNSSVVMYSGNKVRAEATITKIKEQVANNTIEQNITSIKDYLTSLNDVQDSYLGFVLAGFGLDKKPLIYQINENGAKQSEGLFDGSGAEYAEYYLQLNPPVNINIFENFGIQNVTQDELTRQRLAMACNYAAYCEPTVGGHAESIRFHLNIYFFKNIT